jgi:hypothetical protein
LKKKIITLSVTGSLTISMAIWFYLSEPQGVRAPASIPSQYEAQTGCQKQETLWQEVQKSLHADLPAYDNFGVMQLIKMSFQELKLKGDHFSDFAPEGWKKYIHRRGALAKVKIVARDSAYTGVFKGADCALLRLSLTYRAKGSKPVAPGLALKILRDGNPSANISALVSLEGQGENYNFMQRPMSNIVPMSSKLGQKLVHRLFSKVSSYPEELKLNHFAEIDTQGIKIAKPRAPRQLFFVPKISFETTEHDVRDDFLSIPQESVVYEIHALGDEHKNFDYANYTDEKAEEFLKISTHIADIVTTSEFAASSFGDDGLFFRHEMHPKKLATARKR